VSHTGAYISGMGKTNSITTSLHKVCEAHDDSFAIYMYKDYPGTEVAMLIENTKRFNKTIVKPDNLDDDQEKALHNLTYGQLMYTLKPTVVSDWNDCYTVCELMMRDGWKIDVEASKYPDIRKKHQLLHIIDLLDARRD